MDSYEKKYKEALERARHFYNELAACRTKQKVATIFPELTESEDERIRKVIHKILLGLRKEIFTTQDEVVTKDKALAYLEKQKYDRMKPVYDNQDSFESALEKAWKDYNDSGARTVDGCEDNYVECAHAKGFREGYLFGLEKQKEQKPILRFKVGDKIHLIDGTSPNYEDDCITIREIGTVNYIGEFKEGYIPIKEQNKWELVKEQKPAEWSEQDEKMVKEALYCVGYTFGSTHPLVAWLKSLSSNLKKKNEDVAKLCSNEWSEEDEAMRNNIIRCLSAFVGTVECESNPSLSSSYPTYRREIDWLKSLRPSWKPSEEQMEALEYVIRDYREDGCNATANYLQEILDHLKNM